MLKKLLVVGLLMMGVVGGRSWVLAQEDCNLLCLEDQIKKLAEAREKSMAATVPLEAELDKLEKKLALIEAQIGAAEKETEELAASIDEREGELAGQYQILAARVRSFYKRQARGSPFLLVLASSSAGDLTRELALWQAATDQDKQVIVKISEDLFGLEADKKKLEQDRAGLAKLREQVDREAAFFRKEVKGAKDYQAELAGKIAELTAKQQAILGQRLAGLNLPTSLGAGPLYCTDDRKLDPGFSPAVAFYTFGIPHRVGMNQYGALGRAQAGQSYQDILRAYFEGINFEKKSNINIKVQGYGEMPVETYLLGIYEIPGSWPMEALKAQAVAARSYALAYTGNGAKEICTTQACQVYKGGNKGGDWEQAVKSTEGEVMVNGGQVITAWYASTAGGYTFTSADVGWSSRPWTKRLRDTNGEVSSFADLQSKAYDKESPCFYAAQGWRNEYGKSAWLKSSEVADIVNALMLAKADSSAGEHLYQTDKPHPYGGEIWDEGRVKNELRARGITPYNSVSGVSVGADFGVGRTTNVTVSGDAGTQSFSGEEFKNYFNLRAPANIQIVGPLYNVEKR